MEKKGWKDIPEGGLITEAGSARKYKTGQWRTFRPVWDKEKCINCMFCWVHCPDSSIVLNDDRMAGIDYEHCKGCGICSKVCPKKCIKMEKE